MSNLAFLIDDRDDRASAAERSQLMRFIQILRPKFDVEIFSIQIGEEAFLAELTKKEYVLILAPWDCYFSWSRVEAFYGITRTSGPTFAGYFCSPLNSVDSKNSKNIQPPSNAHRVILLDLTQDMPEMQAHWIWLLSKDITRAGLIPLFQGKTPPCYSENWMAQEELGARFENLLRLPEIAENHWKSLSGAIRVCLGAVWGWIFDESGATVPSAPKVFFQFAASADLLVFRFFISVQRLKPSQVVQSFWPSSHAVDSLPVLLATHGDFVRIHSFGESPFMELTVGFFPKTQRDILRGICRNFWIEPLDPLLLREPQFVPLEALSKFPHLKPFPLNAGKVHQLGLLQNQVQGLNQKLSEREFLIRELRSGGVGTPTQLPPPDAEGMLEAFRGHYFQIENELRELELEAQNLQQSASQSSSNEIVNLQRRILVLTQKEAGLLRSLAETMELFHRRFSKGGKTGAGGRHG